MSDHEKSGSPHGDHSPAGPNCMAHCVGLRRHSAFRRTCNQHVVFRFLVASSWSAALSAGSGRYCRMKCTRIFQLLFEPITIQTTRREVEKIVIPEEDSAHLPVETYPIISGIKGGLAGGVAMIPPALLYGLIAEHSIWYPINLLGGAGVANWRNPTTADIAAFHWQGFIVATVIHFFTCSLVGLLYGAMLPMLPRRPVLLGGVIAPVLWTGLLHSTMGIVNPVLDEHIAWGWFLVSQVCIRHCRGTCRCPPGTYPYRTVAAICHAHGH